MAIYVLDDPTVMANGNPIFVSPNSVKFDDGDGETQVRKASSGGGQSTLVISDNVEDKIGKLMFELPNDIASMNLARSWKKTPGQNVFEVNATVGGVNFSRVFTTAVVKNPIENELTADGKIPIEVNSDPT